MSEKKIAIVFGTRPEAIKLAPVIRELERAKANTIKISTGQHLSMLWQALDFFGLSADYDLGVMRDGQSLPILLARIIGGIDDVLRTEQPDILIVQGDTATALGSALAAYFAGISVAHVEAGLRTYDDQNPFPEEANRSLISRIAKLHFCPTPQARDNLLKEGIDPGSILVTGNTVIDALTWARTRLREQVGESSTSRLRSLIHPVMIPREALHKYVLVTSHRRENFGQGLADICAAICELITRREDVYVVWPVHLNPHVRSEVAKSLGSCGTRLARIEPVDYETMLFLLEHCRLILTDSGGIQEEAATFSKPVLIMRTATERPEILEVGGGLLVGTDPHVILREVIRLLDDDAHYSKMASARNPFGDGHAAERIVEWVMK